MNKILLLSTVLFLNGLCFSMEDKPKGSYYSLEKLAEKNRALLEVAERYRSFLNQFGQKETGDLAPLMNALFAPDVKKFVNDTRNPVVKTKEELYKQILNAKEGENGVGTWDVHEASEPIPNLEKNTVVTHFEIATQKKGTIVVMKKLVCNNNGLIQEINEVFNFKTS